MKFLTAPIALIVMIWALWVLESARFGVDITNMNIDGTPVTRLSDGTDGPPVIVAHGFAGSRQMMLGYSLVLAQAGYSVFSFDFEGHGRHRTPMRGDVTSIDGTTQLLVRQTLSVVKAASDGRTPVALLGHSMASDILVRTADQMDGDVGPVVLISAFSQAIDAQAPQDLLLIAGAWEPGLTLFALNSVQMVTPDARIGQTVTSDDLRRRAVVAPFAEHVSILHARAGRREAVAWLNGYYGLESDPSVARTGWALLALLAAITALAAWVARLVPARATGETPLRPVLFVTCTVPAGLIAPLIATQVEVAVLPVLVADYLVLHLAIYGGLQLAVLFFLRGSLPRVDWRAGLTLVVWALAVFGVALDRYGANFLPTPERVSIIAALCLGSVPFMVADAWLTASAPLWQRICSRLVFLASLGLAVALDFEDLLFLMMIAPVIVVFWVTFGLMGRWFSQRTGATSTGLALGFVLAWALGVSFPLFQA